MFNCSSPKISDKLFKSYDLLDFYRDVKEAIPPNMPEPRGPSLSTSAFVDSNLAGNKVTRQSQIGVLILLNKGPIHWCSKQQATAEVNTFGAEFVGIWITVEMVKAMMYKLRVVGVPLDGPTNVFCDNEVAHTNTVIPESTLKKKHHSIVYH